MLSIAKGTYHLRRPQADTAKGKYSRPVQKAQLLRRNSCKVPGEGCSVLLWYARAALEPREKGFHVAELSWAKRHRKEAASPRCILFCFYVIDVVV